MSNPAAFAPAIAPIFVPEDVQKVWNRQLKYIIEEFLIEEISGEEKSYSKISDTTVDYMYYYEKNTDIIKAHGLSELFCMLYSNPVSRIFNAIKDEVFEMHEEEYRENGITTISLDRESISASIISYVQCKTCEYEEVDN